MRLGTGGGGRRHARPKVVAAWLCVVSLGVIAVPAAQALDLGSTARSLPVELPVCPAVLPGTVRCTSVLLTDQRMWSAAVPAVPKPNGVLGLLTTTTRRRATTSTTRPTTTTTTASTSTTTPSTTTTTGATTTTVPGTHAGFGPAELRAAYGLTSAATTAGQGQTVALVDVYDHPRAEADLGVYRSYYGLPACTTANGCFRKVDQRGGTAYPAGNAAWDQEIALDIDMVSAVCPNCHILLVEADSVADSDISAAENRAVAMGATAISNSFVGPDAADDSAFHHAGVAITASSGDDGNEVNFPASSNGVTAVGGTSLAKSTTARGWSETAWSGSGSGCAAYATKPSWQHDSGCAKRTIADVAAVADPKTGVAAYDSVDDGAGHHGWLVFGGTSVGAPLIASVYALAGNASTAGPGYPYAHASALNDVTSGTNGSCTSYICKAGLGYDGPTGLGTPAGVGGF